MKPQYVTYTTTGVKPWIPLDYHKDYFAVSLYTQNGTATIEFTVDDLRDPNVTPVAAGTASPGQLLIPCTGVRVNVSAAPCTFKVLQSGI